MNGYGKRRVPSQEVRDFYARRLPDGQEYAGGSRADLPSYNSLKGEMSRDEYNPYGKTLS